MTSLRKIYTILLAAALLLTASCKRPEPTVATEDPHAGMVEVPDGAGGTMWAPLVEGVALNDLDPGGFSRVGEIISYTGADYEARLGVDVSFYQGDIDWEVLSSEGIEFAIIRAGYRGYTKGLLVEDERFHEYARDAQSAGIEIGVYFFSQAVNVREAREEAELTLSLIKNYDIKLPVFFDWETIGYEEARTDNVGKQTATDCALAFCSVIREAEYDPGIYVYRSLGYYGYDLSRFGGIALWAGAPGDYPDFYYKHDIWQYSFTGKIRGIDTEVDLNLMFIPR